MAVFEICGSQVAQSEEGRKFLGKMALSAVSLLLSPVAGIALTLGADLVGSAVEASDANQKDTSQESQKRKNDDQSPS